MSKELQAQAFKYLVLGGLAYMAYLKIKSVPSEAVEAAGKFASTKLNPASVENLVYTAVGETVGKENLDSAGLSFFDGIDTAAEWLGFENGINGVKGTTAEMNEKLQKSNKANMVGSIRPVG